MPISLPIGSSSSSGSYSLQSKSFLQQQTPVTNVLSKTVSNAISSNLSANVINNLSSLISKASTLPTVKVVETPKVTSSVSVSDFVKGYIEKNASAVPVTVTVAMPKTAQAVSAQLAAGSISAEDVEKMKQSLLNTIVTAVENAKVVSLNEVLTATQATGVPLLWDVVLKSPTGAIEAGKDSVFLPVYKTAELKTVMPDVYEKIKVPKDTEYVPAKYVLANVSVYDNRLAAMNLEYKMINLEKEYEVKATPLKGIKAFDESNNRTITFNPQGALVKGKYALELAAKYPEAITLTALAEPGEEARGRVYKVELKGDMPVVREIKVWGREAPSKATETAITPTQEKLPTLTASDLLNTQRVLEQYKTLENAKQVEPKAETVKESKLDMANRFVSSIPIIGKYFTTAEEEAKQKGLMTDVTLTPAQYKAMTGEEARPMTFWEAVDAVKSMPRAYGEQFISGMSDFGRLIMGKEPVAAESKTLQERLSKPIAMTVPTDKGVDTANQMGLEIASGKSTKEVVKKYGIDEGTVNYMVLSASSSDVRKQIALNNPVYVSRVGTDPLTSSLAEAAFGANTVQAAKQSQPVGWGEKARMYGGAAAYWVLSPEVTGVPVLDLFLAPLTVVSDVDDIARITAKTAARTGAATHALKALDDVAAAGADRLLVKNTIKDATVADLIRNPDAVIRNPEKYDALTIREITKSPEAIKTPESGNVLITAKTVELKAAGKITDTMKTEEVVGIVTKEIVSDASMQPVLKQIADVHRTDTLSVKTPINIEVSKQIDDLLKRYGSPESVKVELPKTEATKAPTKIEAPEAPAIGKVQEAPTVQMMETVPTAPKVAELPTITEVRVAETVQPTTIVSVTTPADVRRILSMSQSEIDNLVAIVGEGNLGVKLVNDVKTMLLTGQIGKDEAIALLKEIKVKLPALCRRIC